MYRDIIREMFGSVFYLAEGSEKARPPLPERKTLNKILVQI